MNTYESVEHDHVSQVIQYLMLLAVTRIIKRINQTNQSSIKTTYVSVCTL